jgi:hypothetical protein
MALMVAQTAAGMSPEMFDIAAHLSNLPVSRSLQVSGRVVWSVVLA